MALTFYEFFAGGGMARVGLGPAWRCAFANDFDPQKAAAYRLNHGDDVFTPGDVRSVSPRDLPGCADLAWASFPCQDLSLAGRGAGLEGARSGAFWPFWTLVRALAAEGRAPQAIVLENVCGVLTSKGGEDFAAIAGAIAAAGYRLGALQLDAADYVPQSRPRVFVIAMRDRLHHRGSIGGGAPGYGHTDAIRGAVASLPAAVARKWVWWRLAPPPPLSTTLANVIDDHPVGVRWHSAADTRRLIGMMSDVNLAKLARLRSRDGEQVGAVYRRTRRDALGVARQRAELRVDGLAGCLRTPGGGSSRQTLLFVAGARTRSRLLSTREAARLMGLPDSFLLPDRYNAAYHLLGDGVVAPIVRHLAREILEPAFGRSTAHAMA